MFIVVVGSASCMDHSCQPNAVVVFNGTELHVRNTVAIDTSQPIKVCIYTRS